MRGPCGLERSFSTIDAWIPFIHSHSTRFSDLYKTSNRRDVVRNHLEKAQVQAFCSPERHVILARAALVALATNSAATTGTGGASCGRYLKCQAFKKISASREVFSRTGSYSKAESSLAGHQAPHRAATPYRTIGRLERIATQAGARRSASPASNLCPASRTRSLHLWSRSNANASHGRGLRRCLVGFDGATGWRVRTAVFALLLRKLPRKQGKELVVKLNAVVKAHQTVKFQAIRLRMPRI